MVALMALLLSGLRSFAADEGVVKMLDEVQASVTSSVYCQSESEYVAFDRLNPRDYESHYLEGSRPKGASFDENYIVTKPEGRRIFQSYQFTNEGGNKIALGVNVERDWRFFSLDASRNGTYLWVTDSPGTGKLPDLMESAIIMIPRVTRPRVEDKGDETHVLLPTGERVVFHKESKVILRGALSEKAVDKNPNEEKRKFPQIDYHGYGLTITQNARGYHPLSSKTATVNYQGKTCTIPSSELWQGVEFKYSSDDDLKKYLKEKCSYNFQF